MGEIAFIRKWIIEKEGVLLAVIPFAGYLIAFSFEAGYSNYYDIPIRFIDFNFITIVIATAVAILYLYLFYLYIHFALLIKKEKHVIWHVMSRIMLYLLPPVFWIVFIEGSTVAWRVFWVIAALITLYYLVPPLLSRQEKGGYWLGVKQMLNSKATHEEPRPISGKNNLFESIHSVMMPVALSIIICFAIGRSYAETEKQFWVLENSPDTIMLRKYGDYMVLKKYNVKTHEIEDGVQVRRLADSGGLSIKLVDIGALKKVSSTQSINTKIDN